MTDMTELPVIEDEGCLACHATSPVLMMSAPGVWADEIKWSHWDLIAFVNSNNDDSSGVKIRVWMI